MRRLLPLAALALLIAACSGPKSAGDGSEPADAAARDTGGTAAGSALAVRAVGAADLRSVIQQSESPVKLVNVWATWCGPCRQEFPDLMRVYRDYRGRGLELVLVSADFDDQLSEVRKFLGRQGVDFPTFIKTGGDMEFIEALSPKWSGAIPATFVYDGGGTLRHFHEGSASYQDFERQIVDVLDSKPPTPKEEGS
jgi:thiol-disulfide isomerase/thioredoxin